eukprot:TRINITY_DN898_c2_g1_i1.p1 TRINITY_DN898_c2_g1~~TRINITY_DN898_c2_g1_i1.p1  ORF type:complete len:333 (+),score=43.93 TRINITY_DN898_c2_g1_i1:60-1058(+)
MLDAAATVRVAVLVMCAMTVSGSDVCSAISERSACKAEKGCGFGWVPGEADPVCVVLPCSKCGSMEYTCIGRISCEGHTKNLPDGYTPCVWDSEDGKCTGGEPEQDEEGGMSSSTLYLILGLTPLFMILVAIALCFYPLRTLDCETEFDVNAGADHVYAKLSDPRNWFHLNFFDSDLDKSPKVTARTPPPFSTGAVFATSRVVAEIRSNTRTNGRVQTTTTTTTAAPRPGTLSLAHAAAPEELVFEWAEDFTKSYCTLSFLIVPTAAGGARVTYTYHQARGRPVLLLCGQAGKFTTRHASVGKSFVPLLEKNAPPSFNFGSGASTLASPLLP